MLALDLTAVGLQWLLRTLGTTHASGTLQVKEEWGDDQLRVRDGVPGAIDAQSQTKGRVARDVGAVAAMVITLAWHRLLHPGADPRGDRLLSESMSGLLETGCGALNKLEGLSVTRPARGAELPGRRGAVRALPSGSAARRTSGWRERSWGTRSRRTRWPRGSTR